MFYKHVVRALRFTSYAGSVIMKVTYGYQTKSQNDAFLLLAEQVMDAFSQASQPGAWLVDMLPWSTSKL